MRADRRRGDAARGLGWSDGDHRQQRPARREGSRRAGRGNGAAAYCLQAAGRLFTQFVTSFWLYEPLKFHILYGVYVEAQRIALT
jgi:hypothetical protein